MASADEVSASAFERRPILLSMILLLFPMMTASAQPTDTDALTIFRWRADVHGILAANWSTPDACSGRWLGVGCSGGGRVTSLSLPSLDLRGPLDPLASLSELRNLDLHGNRLNGTLAASIPFLPNLKLLYLSHNDLSGEIPLSIPRRLLRIDLADNNLCGSIPPTLASLTRLLTLRLQDNLLSGTVPDLSMVLPALKDLNFSNNDFRGSVPLGMRTRFGDAAFAGSASLVGSSSSSPVVIAAGAPAAPASASSVVPSNPSKNDSSVSPAVAMDGIGADGGRLRLSRAAVMGIAMGNAAFILLLVATFLVAAYCCCSSSCSQRPGLVVDEEEAAQNKDNCPQRRNSNGSGNKGNGDLGGESDGSGVGDAKQQATKLVFFDDEDDDDEDEDRDMSSSSSSDESQRRRRTTTKEAAIRAKRGIRRESSVVVQGRRRFELEDLLRASAEMLGKGSLGTVYRAVLEDGWVVAVKRLRDANPCHRAEFEGYMDLIGALRHPNVVSLRAYYYARQEKLLIYDYMPNGTLHRQLHHQHHHHPQQQLLDTFNWEWRVQVAMGVARGLCHIHEEHSSSSIPHGNVTSSNVLLDSNGAARLSDFGLALLIDPAHATARLGGYMAPEQMDSKRLSQEADVYAFGVLMLELLTGKPPLLNNAVTLPQWVRMTQTSATATGGEAEVFDPELLVYPNIKKKTAAKKKAIPIHSTKEEMVAMLHVGLACAATEPDLRPTMTEVAKMMQEIVKLGPAVEQQPVPELAHPSPPPAMA